MPHVLIAGDRFVTPDLFRAALDDALGAAAWTAAELLLPSSRPVAAQLKYEWFSLLVLYMHILSIIFINSFAREHPLNSFPTSPTRIQRILPCIIKIGSVAAVTK